MSEKEYGLFHNPMVEAAKNALTPEQKEQYKKIGEYMYNKFDYTGSEISEPKEEDLAVYATAALNSGLDPFQLSDVELRALIDLYGQEWHTRFNYAKEEVPVPTIQLVRPEMNRKKPALSRQQRRFLEKQATKRAKVKK